MPGTRARSWAHPHTCPNGHHVRLGRERAGVLCPGQPPSSTPGAPCDSRAPARAALAAAVSATTLVVGVAATADARDDAHLTPHTHFVVQPLNPDGRPRRPTRTARRSRTSTRSRRRSAVLQRDRRHRGQVQLPYISELQGIEQAILAQLPDPRRRPTWRSSSTPTTRRCGPTTWRTRRALQLRPALQNTWVRDERFPATPGMPALVQEVADRGYDVYGITGRSASQEPATLANLEKVGYSAFDADNFYTKFDATSPKPDYLDCHTSVDPERRPGQVHDGRVQGGTRAHIESTGETIVLNIGDQYSGPPGRARNCWREAAEPDYYLPSPDIQGAPPPTARSRCRPSSTWPRTAPAASPRRATTSPTSTTSGPRSAPTTAPPTASRTRTSPYITQMTNIAKRWKAKLHDICATGVKRKRHPAVVFDADDTTLWTYDMEDGR